MSLPVVATCSSQALFRPSRSRQAYTLIIYQWGCTGKGRENTALDLDLEPLTAGGPSENQFTRQLGHRVAT